MVPPAKVAAAGRFVLTDLDECGFSPSQPPTASWAAPGQRQQVPYEYPTGRRGNMLAAYSPERNHIEPVFGGSKRHDLRAHADPTWGTLAAAVDEGCHHAHQRLRD